MVTFRFYLVSVVAFFLALAVGVVVGSVLDGRIADSLQDRLDRVETSLDETVAAMDEKNREIDELDAYVAASAPYAVQDELLQTTSLIVVEPGIDAEPVEDLVTRLRQAGSRVDGIVWLEDAWDLSERDRLEELAAIAGAQGSTPSAVRRSFWSAVFESAAASSDASEPDSPDDTTDDTTGDTTGDTTVETTTTVATTTTADSSTEPIEVFSNGLLADAAAAGLLRFQEIDGAGGVGGGELVVAVVTGLDSTADDKGAAAVEIAEESAAAGLATTLAEVFITSAPESIERGELVSGLLDDGPLAFSTVDDMDRISGRVAVALALADARDEVFGRFGSGPEADAVLPPWQAP